MRYDLISPDKIREIINAPENQGKEIQTMTGFGWKGAHRFHNQSIEAVEGILSWGAAFDCEVTDEYIFVNGFSECDMY